MRAAVSMLRKRGERQSALMSAMTREGVGQAGAVAHDADMAAHGAAEAHDGGGVGVRPVAVPGCRPHVELFGLRQMFGDVGGDARGKDDRLEQRVGGEPIGAVRAGRGALAAGPQAVERSSGRAPSVRMPPM